MSLLICDRINQNRNTNTLQDAFDTVNARQFYDFVQPPQDEEECDDFFGIHEKPQENAIKNFISAKHEESNNNVFRRSLSHGDLNFLVTALEDNLILRNSSDQPEVEKHDPTKLLDVQTQEIRWNKSNVNPINEEVLSGPSENKIISVISKSSKAEKGEHKLVDVDKEPVPKAVIEGPTKLERKPKTIAHTPKFVRKYFAEHPRHPPIKLEQKPLKSTSEKFTRKTTQPLPFSFEVRDRMLLKKKEELIRKIDLERRKLTEFHANPIPRGVLEPKISSRKTSFTSLNGKNSLKEQNVNKATTTPRVLHKKQFELKKSDKPPTVIQEFKLKVDFRTAEREEFRRRQREREEFKTRMVREEEERRRKEEEEKALQQRKRAEFHAQPVRKYKPLPVRQPYGATIPVSPKFCLKGRRKVTQAF